MDDYAPMKGVVPLVLSVGGHRLQLLRDTPGWNQQASKAKKTTRHRARSSDGSNDEPFAASAKKTTQHQAQGSDESNDELCASSVIAKKTRHRAQSSDGSNDAHASVPDRAATIFESPPPNIMMRDESRPPVSERYARQHEGGRAYSGRMREEIGGARWPQSQPHWDAWHVSHTLQPGCQMPAPMGHPGPSCRAGPGHIDGRSAGWQGFHKAEYPVSPMPYASEEEFVSYPREFGNTRMEQDVYAYNKYKSYGY